MAKSHKSRNWHKNNRRSRNMRGGELSEGKTIKRLNDLLTQIKVKLPGDSEYNNATFVSVKSKPAVEIVIDNDDDYAKAENALTKLSKEEPDEGSKRADKTDGPGEGKADEGADETDGAEKVADGPGEGKSDEGAEGENTDGAEKVADGPEKGGKKKNKKNKGKKGGKSQKKNKSKSKKGGKKNNSKKRR